MRTVTVDEIMSWNPCDDYDRPRVESLFAGRESLTVHDIDALGISASDRLWAFIGMMPDDRTRRLYAAHVAEAALLDAAWFGSAVDERSLRAIDTTRKYVRGEADEADLALARADADAAWIVAYDATDALAAGAAAEAARAVTDVTRDVADVARAAVSLAACVAWNTGDVPEVRASEAVAAQIALAFHYVDGGDMVRAVDSRGVIPEGDTSAKR